MRRLLPGLVVVLALIHFTLFFVNGRVAAMLDPVDPDAANFADVARNIVRGRGIVQSAGGGTEGRFIQELAPLPSPLTAQPPLYPLAIAGLSLLGVPIPDAAVALAVAAYACVAAVGGAIAGRLYGSFAGVITALALVAYRPLTFWSVLMMSDVPGLALVLLQYWFLISGRFGLAGLAGGLSVATRFAAAPFLGVGLLYVLRTQPRGALRYVILGAVPVAAVLGRNVFLIGRLTPVLNPTGQDVPSDIIEAARTLALSYAPLPHRVGPLVLVSTILVVGLIMIRRGTVRETMLKSGRWLLPTSALAYFAFILAMRWRWAVDPMNTRMMLPVGAIMVIVLVGWVASVLPPIPAKWTAGVAAAALAVLVSLEAEATFHRPQASWSTYAARSAQLQWIIANTTEDDLIITQGGTFTAFYADRPSVINLSSAPYNMPLTSAALMTYVRRYGAAYRRILLVVRQNTTETYYGPFLASLAAGAEFPGIRREAEMPGAYAFRLTAFPEAAR